MTLQICTYGTITKNQEVLWPNPCLVVKYLCYLMGFAQKFHNDIIDIRRPGAAHQVALLSNATGRFVLR